MRLRSSQTRRPRREGLIANGRTVDQIREYLGVDSLVYVSLEGMLSCVTSGNGHYCDACFCGDYPIPIDPNFHKTAFERGQLRFFDTVGEQRKALR